MTFSNEINVGHIISIFAFIIASLGLFLNLYQLHKNQKTQRAIFLKDLYSMIYSDDNVREISYSIEYKKFKYDDHFHGLKNEKI
jgi:hypothetical protein